MGKFIGYSEEHEPALYIRKSIIIDKKVKQATLKLSALGIVKGFCNGEEIDCDLLTPGWTDYRKRIPFYTFDLTNRLQEGKNVLAFTLGNGWAVGKIAWFGNKHYARRPLMWCDLQIDYMDGVCEHIETDESFRVSFGQIRSNDIFDGEVWDGRCYKGNFSAIDYDDSKWKQATVYNECVEGQENVGKYKNLLERLEKAVVPLTKKKEILLGTYLYNRNGYQIYDCGQNHAGVPEVDIRDAEDGTKLTFIYGEMQNEDGSIYNENLRSAEATDIYICRAGRQSFLPHMTFHGYRYIGIKVEGMCEFEQVRSRMIYSDIDFYSSFVCSDADINQLYKNIINSQKSNFINIPTDCPQRDERLGWTGDAQVFSRSAMFNADCRDFFRKYLIDVIDAQLENGMIDSVAPTVCVDFDKKYGSPAWGDVITILPYEYYCVYKDSSIIELTLSAAKHWVQYCVDSSESYVRSASTYGDWLSIDETTDDALLGSLYMAYSALLTGKMCDIVQDSDSKVYYEVYKKIKETIRDKFMLPNNKLISDTQTAYCLAYTFGIMTKDEVRPHLFDCLHRHKNHLSTGFVGVKYLLPVLCELGRCDLAYEVFVNKDFPSWCYPVVNGATSIWERWDSYVIGKGFSNPGMNSFNHYAFGSVCEWMYEYIIGIRYTQEGMTISPIIDESGKITWAKGTTCCDGRMITVEWKNVENGWTELKIRKPEEVLLDLSGYSFVQILGDGCYLIKY